MLMLYLSGFRVTSNQKKCQGLSLSQEWRRYQYLVSLLRSEMRKYSFCKKKRKKGSEDPGRHRLGIRIRGYCLDSSPPLESGAEEKDILDISIGYNPDYLFKSSTFDCDLRIGSWWNMLSVLMKIKKLLILNTVPVLSVSASLVVPALGLGCFICTLAPILIFLSALLPVCFALALRFQFGFALLLQCCLDGL